MISILLTILKSLGLILLVVLGIIILLILLVLFVPVRYRIDVHRKVIEETPIVIKIRITWLLHLISASFAYPEEVYVRLKLLCFTIFRSDKPREKKEKQPGTEKKKNKKSSSKSKDEQPVKSKETYEEAKVKGTEQDKKKSEITNREEEEKNSQNQKKEENFSEQTGKKDFFKKLIDILKNIKYTITRICDKIKHIIKNIQYYIDIIKSDTFHSAWILCSSQVFSLL